MTEASGACGVGNSVITSTTGTPPPGYSRHDVHTTTGEHCNLGAQEIAPGAI